VAVVPPRARKPRDKGKAEGLAVQVVERWILARPCANRQFSSRWMTQTAAIAVLLSDSNSATVPSKLPGSRQIGLRTAWITRRCGRLPGAALCLCRMEERRVAHRLTTSKLDGAITTRCPYQLVKEAAGGAA